MISILDTIAVVSTGLASGVCWSTTFVDVPLILSASQPSVAATFALYFRRTVGLQQVRK